MAPDRLARVEVQTLFIAPQVLIEAWRNEHNQVRPHSSLGYRPPALEAAVGLPVLDGESLTLQVV